MGLPVNPAQLVQALMQRIQSQQPMANQPLEGGGMSPEVQRLIQQRQQASGVFGSQPSMTASAVAGPRPIASPTVGGPTEWQTKSGKRMAITQSAISNLGQAVQIGAQQKWQKTAAGAEQLWQSYMALQTALDQATDPKQKQQIQKQIDAMMQDKNTMKILEKAHKDPTSPEAVGLQRGMQTSKQEATDQAKLEETFAKIQQALATAQAESTRGQANQALAGLYAKKTEQAGQVTPEVSAKIQGAKDIEAQRAEAEANHWKTWSQVEMDKNQKYYEVGMARAAAMAKSKGNSDLIKMFQTQYTGLAKQAQDITKQMVAVQGDIKATSFLRRGHLSTLRSRLGQLQQQSTQIDNAMKDLNNKISTATAAGAIQMPEPEQPPPASGPPPGTNPANVIDFTKPEEPLPQPQ